MWRILTISLLALGLGSPVTAATQAETAYANIVARLGPPTETTLVADGSRSLAYDRIDYEQAFPKELARVPPDVVARWRANKVTLYGKFWLDTKGQCHETEFGTHEFHVDPDEVGGDSFALVRLASDALHCN